MDGTWTIGELADLAAGALAADPPAQTSGRVNQTPNDRLIRWYATVGLVDPPLSRAGRIARYGRRHLLQLVAVKRRQAQGRSLAEIQQELLGATDTYLESIAGLQLAPARTAGDGQSALTAASGDAAPSAQFWRRAPGVAMADSQDGGRPVMRAAAAAQADAIEPPNPAGLGGAEFVRGLRLAPGVLLVLDGDSDGLLPAHAAEVRSAAAPLLAALARRGYVTGSDQERNRS